MMHRCLSILEILGIIFNIVVDEPKSGPKTTFALACTCRTFQDTALDTLWRSIPSFLPLIKCLPPDAWEKTNRDKNGVEVLSLKRPTMLSDWARCKMYAPRIKHLGVERNYFHSTKITADVVAALKQYNVLPLPNLQAYQCDGTCLVGSLAFGRKLLELEIAYRSHDDESHSPGLVDFLETSLPLLRKMTIWRTHISSFKLPNDFGNIVARLSRLESLSLVQLTLPDDALQILASSPTIRVLLSDNSSEDFLRCVPDSGPIFLELEDFSFYTCNLEESSDLIGRMAPRRLRSIVVVHGEIPMEEFDVRNFFESLEVNCDLAILTSIQLVQRSEVDFPGFEDSDWEYTIDTFEPLFAFQNLHTLCLHGFSIRYALVNTSMERVAAAWPLMRRFELSYDADDDAEHEPMMTLDGLLHIAKYWPQLEYLSLTFNTYIPGDIVTSNKPGTGNCCPLLTVLDVGYSSVLSSEALIAAVLSDIFPNLGKINSEHDWETWDNVMQTMIVMQKVRKQEQMWAEQMFMRTQ